MSNPIVQTVKLLFIAEQLCVIELELSRLTKEIRSADCAHLDAKPDEMHNRDQEGSSATFISGPCWAHQDADDGIPEEDWCNGCVGGQAAYQQRKKLRARRSGLKRRMVNLYTKATGGTG